MGKFTPGTRKPPTSGRKAGTPNKKTETLVAILEKCNIAVPEELCRILNMEGIPGETCLTLKERAQVLMDLMQYLYPKRKALDHSLAMEVDQGEGKLLIFETNLSRLGQDDKPNS